MRCVHASNTLWPISASSSWMTMVELMALQLAFEKCLATSMILFHWWSLISAAELAYDVWSFPHIAWQNWVDFSFLLLPITFVMKLNSCRSEAIKCSWRLFWLTIGDRHTQPVILLARVMYNVIYILMWHRDPQHQSDIWSLGPQKNVSCKHHLHEYNVHRVSLRIYH